LQITQEPAGAGRRGLVHGNTHTHKQADKLNPDIATGE